MADNGTNGSAAEVAGQPCPTCGRPARREFRPFCSRRCADVDLHRWLSGQYAIPVREDDDEDGALPETGVEAKDREEEER